MSPAEVRLNCIASLGRRLARIIGRAIKKLAAITALTDRRELKAARSVGEH